MENKIKPRKSVQNYLFIIPSLFAVILFYAWFVSSGGGNQSGTTTYYYANLAGAFLHGHLQLDIKPDPHLLAMDNPYDPLARMEVEKLGIIIPVDFSLYQGNFYLYWGPVPALLLATIELFSREPVGDFILAFSFSVGIFLMQASLLLAIWDRNFSTLPKWTLHLCILLVGSTLPIALLRHYDDYARIYEAAIAGGQFFLMSGLWVAFTAIASPSLPNWKLVCTGSLWALAIGTRHILVVPIGFMVLLTALWLIRTNPSLAEQAKKLLSLGLPLALGCAGLAWYNWARFGSISETGFSFALAGVDLQKHYTELFSRFYVIQNLYNYLLNPPSLSSNFPFVSMLQGRGTPIVPLYTVPKFYYPQQITGLLYMFPFAIFALVPLLTFLPNLFKGKWAELSSEGNPHRPMAWTGLMLGSCFLTAFLLLIVFFWTGTRYLGDFIPAMTVLSALGFWQGYPLPARKPLAQYWYALSGIILGSVSILMSALLAISMDAALTDHIIRSFPFLK